MTSDDFTDSDWAPLRRVVPSFRPWWQDYQKLSYDPSLGYVGIHELASYVAAVARTMEPITRLRPLFRSIEQLLRATPRLEPLIRIGFFENLMHEATDKYRGFDLRSVYRLLAGSRSRAAWRRGVSWVAPDARWDGRSGWVRVNRYPKSVATVTVFKGHEDPESKCYVALGALRSGVVKQGDRLGYRIGEHHRAVIPITKVGLTRLPGWLPLIRLELGYKDERSRALAGILGNVEYDPRTITVYRRGPRRLESSSVKRNNEP